MVYRHISTDMKCRALQLLDNGWELEEITEVLGISKESVDRWLDCLRQLCDSWTS